MSKLTKRKITVEASSGKHSSSSSSNNLTSKDSQRRQSVFERLGTKTGASLAINTSSTLQGGSSGESFCRHWSQNGTCPYGKTCSFASTHVLISPSKRASKKEAETKQVLSRLLEDSSISGLNKRLHSTVIKRGSPDVNWESWDQTDLEYEDEKVLEKRRQLLQRELELQMKREETEEHHHSIGQRSRSRHTAVKEKKSASSSSSSSVSSSSSTDSSSSSDDSSSGSSSSSNGGASKRRKSKVKKLKRNSLSSASDNERSKKLLKINHKDTGSTTSGKKPINIREKKPVSPPRKSLSSTNKIVSRKKSISPPARGRPATPPPKSKTTTGKSYSGPSRHNQSPRPSNKRSVSIERKDKHNRSISPRTMSRDRDRDRDRDKDRNIKPGVKDRSSPARRTEPPRTQRRKDSPEKSRNDPKRNLRKPSPKDSRSRGPDSRNDDRKKDDDRSRGNVKDDRRSDRKPTMDRDKRDHEDARSREKARETARDKERNEALERCRERQREREQIMAKEKEKRERGREEREKETLAKREYEKDIPSLLTLTTHNPSERKPSDRDRDRGMSKDRKERDKDRDKDRDRLYDRVLDKTERRIPEKERQIDKVSERDRLSEKDRRDRDRDRDHILDRVRDKPDRDRSFERDRVYESRPVDRGYERDKERPTKVIDRVRDRDREKERIYERPIERRSYERDRTSLDKDRPIRDRGLERVLERERNKSLEHGRGSDSERSVDKGRDRFDRDGRYESRRPLPQEEKGYDSPYDARRERSRYPPESNDRVMYKELSPSREEMTRIGRIPPSFSEDRRGRSGRDISNSRGAWDNRSTFDEGTSTKGRDWDYPDSRRDWESRSRRPVEDWEGGSNHGIEADEWNRYSGGADWSGAGDWRDEWPARPSRHGAHPHRDEQAAGHIVSSNHIVVRDANLDDHIHESSARRSGGHLPEEKDLSGCFDGKKDISDAGSGTIETGVKRARDDSDLPTEVKKAKLEEPSSAMLEEALSDISDDADEILNREDVDMNLHDTVASEDDVSKQAQSSSQPVVSEPMETSLLDDRMEEEGMDNLDFEEISDEELEEEAKANKAGLGDALGVDWASLVAETRPREGADTEAVPGSALKRWNANSLLARIGVSLKYAGEELYNKIQNQISEKAEECQESSNDKTKEQVLLHPVAAVHVALREKRAQRKALFSSSDTFRQALSARRDIAIRRQLCNLPVTSLEIQQSAGFCQWVV